jgi:hypothetical protein
MASVRKTSASITSLGVQRFEGLRKLFRAMMPRLLSQSCVYATENGRIGAKLETRSGILGGRGFCRGGSAGMPGFLFWQGAIV